jgi:hypothetical protein
MAAESTKAMAYKEFTDELQAFCRHVPLTGVKYS